MKDQEIEAINQMRQRLLRKDPATWTRAFGLMNSSIDLEKNESEALAFEIYCEKLKEEIKKKQWHGKKVND